MKTRQDIASNRVLRYAGMPLHQRGQPVRLASFAAGFAPGAPIGALLLPPDRPMIPDGVNTAASNATVSARFVGNHMQVGIEALKRVRRNGKSVRHLRLDE